MRLNLFTQKSEVDNEEKLVNLCEEVKIRRIGLCLGVSRLRKLKKCTKNFPSEFYFYFYIPRKFYSFSLLIILASNNFPFLN